MQYERSAAILQIFQEALHERTKNKKQSLNILRGENSVITSGCIFRSVVVWSWLNSDHLWIKQLC